MPGIVIDDSNPAIQYHGGSWLQCSAPNITSIGPGGSPMFETLHMLPTANGTLSYSFNGTGISVFISNFAFNDVEGNVTTKCLLDGKSGESPTNVTLQRGNNMELCTFGGLDVNKTHNFTLDVSFPAGQHQSKAGPTGFLFDYFLISPSPSMSLEKSDVLYSTFDSFVKSAILASNGPWTSSNVTSGGYEAGPSVALFNISFTGVAARWFGFRAPHDEPFPDILTPGTTYSLDDTASVQFSTQVFSDMANVFGFNGGELTQQLLFRTPQLQYGKHTLTVFSPGSSNAGVSPLTIQNLLIQSTPSNNSLRVQTTIRPSFDTAQPVTPFIPNEGPKPPMDGGKVVGGIVGGIFAVVVIAAWFTIARRKRASRNEAVDLNVDPPTPEPFPIQADQETVVVGPRKGRDSQQDIVDPFMQELEAPPLTKWTRDLGRQSGGQPLPIADEDQLPQPDSEIEQHPGPHLQAALVDVDSSSQSSLPELPHAHDANGDTADGSVEVGPVQEEDSGMRLGQQGSREPFVLVLPPVYTEH